MVSPKMSTPTALIWPHFFIAESSSTLNMGIFAKKQISIRSDRDMKVPHPKIKEKKVCLWEKLENSNFPPNLKKVYILNCGLFDFRRWPPFSTYFGPNIFGLKFFGPQILLNKLFFDKQFFYFEFNRTQNSIGVLQNWN